MNLSKITEEKTFIISEIGINHDGSFNKAKKLVKLSKESGAHAVKFQIRDIKKIYNEENKIKKNNTEASNQYIFNVLKKTNLSQSQYIKLIDYAKKIGLKVGVTAWDQNTAKILKYKNIDFIKIGSPDFESFFLVEECLKANKPIILSTGMSDLKSIKVNSNTLKNYDFALLHCCSSYPPKNMEISLKFLNSIGKLSKIFGYSGHEVGFNPTILSLFFGARIIERHITINTKDEGPDHSSSLSPKDFKKMSKIITKASLFLKKKRTLKEFINKFCLEDAVSAIGKDNKILSQNTKFNKIVLGKSIVFNKNLDAGTIIKKEFLEEKTPGYGLTSINYRKFIGRKILAKKKRGDYLSINDFKSNKSSYPKLPMKWGLVGRLGDFEEFIQNKPKLMEIHLTWRELLKPKKIKNNVNYNQELIIHAPEYFNDQLIDFTTKDNKILDLSFEMMERTINLSKTLRNNFYKSNEKTKIVLHPGGHFFNKHEKINKTDKYKNLINNMNIFNEDEYEIVLENMPPYPWYYGGRYYQNIFSNHKEISDFCETTKRRVCFDTSHAQLYCNSNKINMKNFARKIKDHTCYLHLSDAAGVDGEGVQIGEGNVDFEFLIALFKSKNLGFIPEIWQGHLDEGAGFKKALQRIKLILNKISTKSCHGH